VIWNQYTLRLGDLIGLLAALLSVRLYLRLPDTFVRRVAFVALLAGVYYAAGGAFILLVALCAFYELCAKGRMGLALAYVVIGTLLPGVMGEQLFGAELWQTSGGLTGEAMTGAKASVAAWVGLHAFYGLLTVGVVFGTTLRRVQERLAARTGRPVGVKRMGRILMAARPFLLLVVTVGVAFKTHDYKTGTFRRFSYAAQNHMWLAVVEIGRGDPDIFTPYVCRMVNRALYETGRLSSEMFAFPQLPEGGLLPTLALAQPYKSDTLLELGAVNRAEHLALESKEIWGPRPFVVRLLARIALVKGDPSARIWLNMLSKDILHGSWAAERLQRLREDPAMQDDETIARIRSVMPIRRSLEATTEGLLLGLLERSPANRMAFEYLIAHVPRLKELDYRIIPDYFGEALLLYMNSTGESVDLGGLEFSQATLQHNDVMGRLAQAFPGDPAALADALGRELPNSYFRYFMQLSTMSQPVVHE
jgi:hypothetical protein